MATCYKFLVSAKCYGMFRVILEQAFSNPLHGEFYVSFVPGIVMLYLLIYLHTIFELFTKGASESMMPYVLTVTNNKHKVSVISRSIHLPFIDMLEVFEAQAVLCFASRRRKSTVYW